MNKTVIWTLVIFMFVVFVGVFSTQMQQKNDGSVPVYTKLPDFEFHESTEAPFKRAQLYDKCSVFTFYLNTEQADSLSQLIAHMQPILKKHPQVQWLKILPLHLPSSDSIKFTLEPGTHLFGETKDIKNFLEKGFMLPKDALEAIAAQKVILVDSKARIRGYYSKTEEGITSLERDIKLVLQEL